MTEESREVIPTGPSVVGDILYFLKILFIFREREGREKERERNIDMQEIH